MRRSLNSEFKFNKELPMKRVMKIFSLSTMLVVSSMFFVNCQKANSPLSAITSDLASTANSIVPSDSTLVGFWKLEGPSGFIPDSSKYHNNMTNSGYYSFSSGKKGNAYNFPGPCGYINALNHSALSLNITGSLSYELWLKKSSYSANVEMILSKYQTINGVNCGFKLEVLTSGLLKFTCGNSSGTMPFNYDNQWHHVAVTCDASTSLGVFYLDKAVVATFSFSPSASHLSVPLTFGADYPLITTSPKYFTGSMDEVAIYNRTLSSNEIVDHFNN